jgi:hypothetical protein
VGQAQHLRERIVVDRELAHQRQHDHRREHTPGRPLRGEPLQRLFFFFFFFFW